MPHDEIDCYVHDGAIAYKWEGSLHGSWSAAEADLIASIISHFTKAPGKVIFELSGGDKFAIARFPSYIVIIELASKGVCKLSIPKSYDLVDTLRAGVRELTL